MRSEAELNAIDIDQQPRANPWRSSIPVPTVTADGALTVTFLDRKQVQAGEPVLQGFTPVAYTPEMGINVTMHARAGGAVLYEDLCAGKVPGIEASPKHWQLWRSVCELRAQGRDLRRGALEAAATKLGLAKPLHPEVYRRRAAVGDGGYFAAGPEAVLALAGFDGAEVVDQLDLVDDSPKRAKR